MELDSTDGAPRILGFEHMILQVADIEASKHFYLDLLGFTPRRPIPLADGRPVVPFTQGIALTAGNPGKPPQIDHMAFRVTGVRAIAQRSASAGRAGRAERRRTGGRGNARPAIHARQKRRWRH